MEQPPHPNVAVATAILAEDQSEHIARAERVRGSARGPGPTSPVRLSEPLLDALDAICERDGRKRGNLIANVLWDYVRARGKL
jgi:hypothetical protein